MIPKEFEYRESLPKTKIGKVDFRELARQEAERQEKEKN
jgi:acyl-CoA synthetase (AMP-forming)/AMP-acid ligase II